MTNQKKLIKDIGTLVEIGPDPDLQKAFDTVRVIGNNAVHPGTIDIRDDRVTATALFMPFDTIADRMITQPRKNLRFSSVRKPRGY